MMFLEDKISQLISYIFAIALMCFFLYLVFTQKWFLYLMASFNVITTFALIFLLIRNFFKKEE